MKMIPVTVSSLALDANTKSPVVVLTPEGQEKVLPIWIGHSEAWVIAMELSKMNASRPMTHDLLKTALETLETIVTRADITDLRDQTFYAMLTLSHDSNYFQIDARPSDSIAMALKFKAPIYVAEELFNLAEGELRSEAEKMNLTNDPESLAERLKKINPEDFGKYTL